MPGEPVKRRGSLQRRLQGTDLAYLCVAPLPPPAEQPPLQRRRPPADPLRTLVLALCIQAAFVLFGIGRALVGPSDTAAPAHSPEPTRDVRLVHRTATEVATAQNIEDLAQILMSEASPGIATTAESAAVGYTVLNRMQVTGTAEVRDVWDAYAHHATPTNEIRTLAAQVLRGEIADPSAGATHFYSPRSMPMEGDVLRGYDTAGGLEQTPGLRRQNYRPGWAIQYERVVVAGVRASHYKFYRRPSQAFQE